MKLSALILILIIAGKISAQNVKVTDYRVPISFSKTLRLDGSYSWSQTGNNVTSNNASANLLYRTFYSSLPLAWFIDVDAVGSKNYGDYSHNVQFDGSFRKYIWPNRDWFGFSRVTANHATNYNNIASDLTTGFGFGRYIDATALAKAVRIEDHLLRDNVISRHLPKETMISIANIIERENEYQDTYGETYETYWFDAIEDEIKKTEALEGENVGSLGILRMRQVLFSVNERVNPRFYGWDLTAGILFPITSATDSIPPGNPNITIGGRYAFPLSWRVQVNTTAEVFTPMDSAFFKQVRTRFGIDFIYEFSNRINFVSGYRFTLFKPQTTASVIEHNWNGSFWYYLENNIYFTLRADFIKQGNAPRILSTRVGLQYNLL
jgi:hypothetical protein